MVALVAALLAAGRDPPVGPSDRPDGLFGAPYRFEPFGGGGAQLHPPAAGARVARHRAGRILEHGDGRRDTARTGAHWCPARSPSCSAVVSVATIVAVPLGSYLGGLYGWRSVFLFATLIGVVTLLCQMAFLPRLVANHASRLGTLAEVLLRPGVRLGVLCSVLVFGGHFALFTYVRPFFETVAGVGVRGIALMLLGFGCGEFRRHAARRRAVGAQPAPDAHPAAARDRCGGSRPGRVAGRPAGACASRGTLGTCFRRHAGRLVNLDGACGAGRDGERGGHPGRGGPDRHCGGRGLGRVSLRLQRRGSVSSWRAVSCFC